ncbi:hypothetical protein FHR86_003819 [Paenarthrobacter ilicis]|uniref:Uncharacterized protein n=1 Tax=Paenarthrobacter ilicis TaxID=43665 RepID=A0ABX0TQH3_9MICC|nr:hypothetical protein [Paenarthrobacter ilicis]NIJ03460.1 hypothetical protein [Paenarthrobacter ilicis]
MIETLAAQVESYLDDPDLVLLPDHPEKEVRANTWSYSAATSPRSSAADLAAALDEVVNGLRDRFGTAPNRGTFYAWYDEQAGQLRCSLTSQSQLPFGGRIRKTTNSALVIDRMLSDQSPGFISFGRLREVPFSSASAAEAEDDELIVWAVLL